MFLAQDKVAAHTHFGDFEIWKGDPDYMVGKDKKWMTTMLFVIFQDSMV
jgi:hypothetical protein